MKAIVSGLGIVSSLGINSEDVYKRLLLKKSYFQTEKRIYTGFGEEKKTAQIRKDDIKKINHYLSSRKIYFDETESNYSIFAAYSILKAIEDSNIDIESINKMNVLIVFASNDSHCTSIEHYIEGKKSLDYSSYCVGQAIINKVGIKKSRTVVINNACASFNTGVDVANKYFQNNKIDIAIICGIEVFSKRVFAGLDTVNCLTQNECKPFCKLGDGSIIAEGSVAVVLTNSKLFAEQNVYCEVCASACVNHTESVVQTSSASIKMVYDKLFDSSEYKKQDVNYIMAHGNGIIYHDKEEAEAVSSYFENIGVEICSIKNCSGYMLGASGGLGLVSICEIMKNGIIPGNDYKKEDCFFQNITLILKNKVAFVNDLWCNNSFGMGGNSSVLLLKAKGKD